MNYLTGKTVLQEEPYFDCVYLFGNGLRLPGWYVRAGYEGSPTLWIAGPLATKPEAVKAFEDNHGAW